MLACGSVGLADEAEEAAAKWVESVGGVVTRAVKDKGKPINGVNLALKEKVTNDGLANLTGCKHIKQLNLFNNEQITGAGMKHIAELKTLEALVLNGTAVGDEGLTELKGLTSLKDLSLAGTVRLSDKSTETIKEFTNLEALALPSTITEKGVKNLVTLKKLKLLYIGGANLNDAAIKDIAENMPELRSLELGVYGKIGTRITDESIPSLIKLKKLVDLGLAGSKITDAGQKELQKALPDCKIRIRP